MVKQIRKKEDLSNERYGAEDSEYEEDMECEEQEQEKTEDDESTDEHFLSPEDFEGDGGAQTIGYIQSLLNKVMLATKRGKGKHPSSEHPSNGGPSNIKKSKKEIRQQEEAVDPDYVPPPPDPPKAKGRGKSSGRGRGRGGPSNAPTISTGRGRGRATTIETSSEATASKAPTHNPSRNAPTTSGRGRAKTKPNRNEVNPNDNDVNPTASNNSSKLTPRKGEHWRADELAALIKGANHMKPVLKGKFRLHSDGVKYKRIAWEELTDYVNSNGGRCRSRQQVNDKLGYFVQQSKKKRQAIDAKYRTGSGRRDDEDHMTELEQAACDYAGSEVTLGIPNMQPPSVKTGQRPKNPSCYDPQRATRDDYEGLGIPSNAMAAAIDRDLLVDEQYEEGEDVEGEDDNNGVHRYNEESMVQEEEEEEEDVGNNALLEDNDAITEPRISKDHMMKICTDVNKMLNLARGKKPSKPETTNDKTARPKPGTNERKPLRNITTVKDNGKKKVTLPPVAKGKPAKQEPEEEEEAIEILDSPPRAKKQKKKAPDFKNIIDEEEPQLETPDDSPLPSSHIQERTDKDKNRNKPSQFAERHIEASTPLKQPSPILNAQDKEDGIQELPTSPHNQSVITRHRSPGLDRIQRDAKRNDYRGARPKTYGIKTSERPLPNPTVFDKGEEEYVTPSALRNALLNMQDMITQQQADMSLSIAQSHKELNEQLLHHQQQSAQAQTDIHDMLRETQNSLVTSLVSNHRKVQSTLESTQIQLSSAIIESQSHIHAEMLSLHRRNAESNTAVANSVSQEMRERYQDMTETYTKCVNRMEEATEAVTTIQQKLTAHILNSQIKLVKGMDKVCSCVGENAVSISQAQQSVVEGIGDITSVVEKLGESIKCITLTTQAASEATKCSIDAANTSRDSTIEAVEAITQNLKSLAVSQDNLNKGYMARALLELRAARPAETDKIKPAEETEPCAASRSVSQERQPSSSTVPVVLYSPHTSAYLTHPDPPTHGEGDLYNVCQTKAEIETPHQARLSGTFLHHGHNSTVQYLLPGSAVVTEEEDDKQPNGLPEYTVLNKDDFVIVQADILLNDMPVESHEANVDHAQMVRNLRNPEYDTETQSEMGDNEEEIPRDKRKRSTRTRTRKK